MSGKGALLGNSVQEYYVDWFRERARKRARKLAAVQTPEQAAAYVGAIRAAIRGSFPLPAEKCDLAPHIAGELDGGSYRLLKIHYDSRPNFPVTGSLLLPKSSGRHPAVLFLCGHAQSGKSDPTYQTCCANLARQGYVVLAIDPAGQGERGQLWRECGGRPYPSCTVEHNLIGREMSLAGEVFSAWRAWDAIRGIDFLLTRPEVDPVRLGLTGNSGGGTMTAWVGALDDRLAMAAPSCYITSFLHNVENELPVDMEQLPAGLGRTGMEMADLILAQAPRPVLILGQARDFFDPRGTVETFDEAKRVYELLGAGKNLQCFIGPSGHGYSVHNRTRMYAFFNNIARISASTEECPDLKIREDRQLWAAPEGQIVRIPGAKTIPELVRREGAELRRQRTAHPLSGAALRRAVLNSLALPSRTAVPHYRVLRPESPARDGGVFSRFGLETEPGRVMCVLKRQAAFPVFHLEENLETLLYIPHLDSSAELARLHLRFDGAIYGLDVRGVGECRPSGCDQGKPNFFEPYNADYHFASLGYFLGRPYLGGKVRDILAALELLTARSGRPVRLFASGQGMIPALLAAFLAGPSKVSDFRTDRPIPAWDAMLRHPFSPWPQSCMIPGVLRQWDLPDLAAELKIKCERF